MKKFFAFWTEIPKEDVFTSFDIQHISAMIVIGAFIWWLINAMKAMPPERCDRIIKFAALILPALEVTKIVWLYSVGQRSIVKLLPLHLCSMQIFFIPLAVFTKIKGMKEFVYCTSILSGIAATVFPAGVTGAYPFFHYQTLETLLFHMILVLVPLAWVKCQNFIPNVKLYPRSLIIFAIVLFAAAFVDFNFGQNYMFILQPPTGTPMETIFNTYGRTAYWLLFLTLIIPASLMMFIPFRHKKYKW